MSIQPNTDNKFNLPGSILHYPKSSSFKIDYMMLKMQPDFNSKTLKDCEQQLRITTNKDTNEIKLDIAELDIKDVRSLSSDYIVTEFDQKYEEDNLIIKFNKKLPKMLTIDLLSNIQPDIIMFMEISMARKLEHREVDSILSLLMKTRHLSKPGPKANQ